MQLRYHKEAESNGVYVSGAYVFDSIPPEMGIKFMSNLFMVLWAALEENQDGPHCLWAPMGGRGAVQTLPSGSRAWLDHGSAGINFCIVIDDKKFLNCNETTNMMSVKDLF